MKLEYCMYILYNHCKSLGLADCFDIAEPLSTASKQRPLGTDGHKHQKDWVSNNDNMVLHDLPYGVSSFDKPYLLLTLRS